MKVLMKRDIAVFNGAVVELGSNNIVLLKTEGTPLGIASNCRSVLMQDEFKNDIEYLICEVTVFGDCQALLSGTASKAGGKLYATNDGKVTTTANGNYIGILAPCAFPQTSDYDDNQIVNIIFRGVE